MRRLILSLSAVAFASSILAESQPAASPSPSPSPTPVAAQAADSPMVRAAKSSSAHYGSTKKRIRITNDDVKKSSGKLSVVSAAPLPTPTPEPAEKPGVREERERTEARAKAQKDYEDAQKRIDTLTRSLNAAEEAYYTVFEEGDRDGIEKRFVQAKEELEKAREDADRAKEELSKYE